MRFKLVVIALYALLALSLVAGLRRTAADANDVATLLQEAAQKPAISLDATNGRRGLVRGAGDGQ